MNRQCPQCESDQLSDENPFGKRLCSQCGWVGELDGDQLTLKEALYTSARWAFTGTLLVFFAVMSIQFLRWKNFALEATFLQGKELFGVARENDRMEMGTICNSIENFRCSARVFMKVVKNNPNQRQALANLAMAHAHLSEWTSARPHFEAYFSLRGTAYDVMYWYAKTVFAIEGADKALPWFYYSVSANPSFRKSGVELIRLLNEKGRRLESLGVIGAITYGQPDRFPFWNEKLGRATKPPTTSKGSLELPSFDGQNYFAPVWLRDNGRVLYFSVRETEKENWINEDMLFENLGRVPPHIEEQTYESSEGPMSGRKMTLENVQLGPWKIDSLDVVVCTECRSILGRSVIKPFFVQNNQRYQTRFMTLSKSDPRKEDNE